MTIESVRALNSSAIGLIEDGDVETKSSFEPIIKIGIDNGDDPVVFSKSKSLHF